MLHVVSYYFLHVVILLCMVTGRRAAMLEMTVAVAKVANLAMALCLLNSFIAHNMVAAQNKK